jgi:uncharacterized protein
VKPSKRQSELKVTLATGATITALVYPAAGPGIGAALILGHGAGAGQDSRFMVDTSRALSNLGLDLVTFNFPYTEQGRRIPDRAPLLEACYQATIETVRRDVVSAQRHLFIGGKSMGGRIATNVAAADSELPIEGLVLLGYPLHPPGRPEQRRDKHLPSIERPMLIVQGSRDAFGTPAELEPILTTLPRPATLHVVPGGDHSFKVPRIDPSHQTAMIEEVHRTIAAWIASIVNR